MFDARPKQGPLDVKEKASEPVDNHPYAEILGLARKASSRHGFLSRALDCIAQRFASPLCPAICPQRFRGSPGGGSSRAQ